MRHVTNEGNSQVETWQANSSSGMPLFLIDVYERVEGGVEQVFMLPRKTSKSHACPLCPSSTGHTFIIMLADCNASLFFSLSLSSCSRYWYFYLNL